MSFRKKIEDAWKKNNSLVCVGLDPDKRRIPPHLFERKNPVFEFCREIIDVTKDLVCAYKPQIAYFAAFDAEDQLKMVIDYIHETCPEIPVILDAKRGDIGSTANMYAMEAFDRYGADAVTVNPYMGDDTLTPYLTREDKGVIVLCRTSNPGAGTFQNLLVGDRKLYEIVAEKAAGEWNKAGNVMLVVGATCPEELAEIRKIVGDMPLLVPGLGAQGGDVKAAVTSGLDSHGAGMIVNSSRGIIFAGGGKQFADAARLAAISMRDEINQYR